MRIRHRYYISDGHLKIINPIRIVLKKYNISYKYEEDLKCNITFKYFFEFFLFEDNPNFNDIKLEIEKFELKPQTGTIYEKADYKLAQWFVVSAGHYQYPQPEDEYKKITFNLDNYCQLCGIGKIQNAPYRIKTIPKQHNNQFWGLHWEYSALFVRQETKNILEKEKVKGIRFSSPLLNKKNIEIEGFYQLHINTILNEGYDSYNTKIITCKVQNEENCNTDLNSNCCGRIKFHHPSKGGYLFDKNIFNSEVDIVQSNEYFGSGARANRINIVSKSFKELVEKNKLKGLAFIPIVHERFK